MTTSLKIVWDEHDNLVIRDVDIKWKDRILAYLKENFFSNDPLFEKLKGRDEEILEEAYMKYFRHILVNECCIVAVNAEDDTIYAIAMVKWMTKKWRSWTELRHKLNPCILNTVIQFTYNLLSKYADEHRGHPFDSLHIFDVYFDNSVVDDDLFVQKFYNAICEVARHMKMPRVTTVTRMQHEHKRAIAQGFTELDRIIYSMYVVNNKRPFDCLRDNNEMFGALFECLVEPVVPYGEMIIRDVTYVYAPQPPSTVAHPLIQRQSNYTLIRN